ncbi:SACS [Symbiodinium sp. CCMP2592]|nr:SACS [Symbiodinium sp. CCMP2592]
MPKAFGLQVSPSPVLRNLLQHYPSGGQFISEALQNAEDTNRSKHFRALLDLQQHPKVKIRQDHRPWRHRLQGPAFLFYDDGGFADRDWESLQRIYDSEKTHSPSEVGKYGMGSRSFFHIGDVIQIVSGSSYAILDPDERVSEKGHFGSRVDFVNERFNGKRFSESYPDECAPFRGLFGCTMDRHFKGTIIRVPLRLEAFARESSFMPKAFSVQRARNVFQDFEQEMACGRMALFLPRLEDIQLLIREPDGVLRCTASVRIQKARAGQVGLVDVKNYLAEFQTFEHLQEALKTPNSAPRVYEEVRLKSKGKEGEKETSWMRVGNFFSSSLQELPEEVPFVCLAMPLDGPVDGLAFAHLPLPSLKTGLPVHLHAGFALQANRRGIWRFAPDLDGEHQIWAEWNEEILESVVPEVYSEGLKSLQAELDSDTWFGLWPNPELKKQDFQVVVTGLVRLLRGEQILQTSLEAWVSPESAQLLDLPTPALEECRDDLEELCLQAGMMIVNLPDHVAKLLKDHEAILTKDAFSAIIEAVLRRDCQHDQRLRILLALMQLADSSFNHREMTLLATELVDLPWIPAISGVWRVLRQCGLRQQITWEDALEEARHIENTSNQKLSKLLFKHLENSHVTMEGNKQRCLLQLRALKWVAAHPCQSPASTWSPEQSRGSTSVALSDAFPASDFPLVWAVQTTLHSDMPPPSLLQAGRSARKEPDVLVAQLEACARAVPELSGQSNAGISGKMWSLARKVFGSARVREAAPDAFRHIRVILSELYDLEGHAARGSSQAFQTLLPAFGIVHPEAHRFAAAVGVPCQPDIAALVETIPRFGLDLAVCLCAELAEQAHAENFRDHLKGLSVPTNSQKFLPLERVYINDASWKGSDDLQTLDDRISHAHGRALGCKSVREKLKQECEAGADDEDGFGQEADLVDQVKLILKDYSSNSDVVAEFVQNTDDFGATELTFELNSQAFRDERVVDLRCKELQGPALYILSNKPLRDEDIKNMQKVGRSTKAFDFASTGRFGVGMNVMYRYTDCPQLFANGRLHFFDLTWSFVAKKGGKRGEKFHKHKLEDMFPDSVLPFQSYVDKFPVIFRLPLRKERSQLGEKVDVKSVERDLHDISSNAWSMLLFAKWLKKFRVQTAQGTISEHIATIGDAAQNRRHAQFFSSLPADVHQLQDLTDNAVCFTKRIRSTSLHKASTPRTSERNWVVAFTLAPSQGRLRQLCIDYFNAALGGALLPLAGAAAPLDLGESEGRMLVLHPIHCLWKHVMSNCIADLLRVANSFAEWQQERQWNLELLQYPAALSLKSVMLECRTMVKSRDQVDPFFQLLPCNRATQAEAELAVGAFCAALKEDIFPVLSCKDSERITVRWVPGPRPLLRAPQLCDKLQDALAFDGMDIVSFPSSALNAYQQALQYLGWQEEQRLGAAELCGFLAERWAARQPSVRATVQLKQVGMASLCDCKSVLALLTFAMPKGNPSLVHPCQHLEGVPLLLTHGGALSAFSEENVRFSSDRDLIPNHPDLFLHANAGKIFAAVAGTVEAPGIRQLELDDLVPYKKEVEAMAFAKPFFQESPYLKHLLHYMSRKSETEYSFRTMKSWRILPVYSIASQAQVVPLDLASQTVAIATDAQAKCAPALLQAGLLLLQSGVLDCAKPLLMSKVVRTDRDVIKLLVGGRDRLTNMTEEDRHELLVFFSSLAVSARDQLSFADINKLPLFKLANGGFTCLDKTDVDYCCLHPDDAHAAALERLMPSSSVLLSFPTDPTRPIYDFMKVQVCNGEDFMVSFIIPQLPKLCRNSDFTAKPYLDELYSFVVKDRSQRVTDAAKDMAFVPSEAGTLKTASSLIDPELPVAQLFASCLTDNLPISWLQDAGFLKLLRVLGMKRYIPAPLLLLCAEDLHERRDQTITKALKEKSFHLVESVAHQLADAFSKSNVGERSSLVKATELNILLTSSIASDYLAKEIEDSMKSPGPALWERGTVKLRPFRRTALHESVWLLWSVCPVAVHKKPSGEDQAPQLEHLIKSHAEEMHSVLGAYIRPTDVPFPSLAQHILNLCSMPFPKQEELAPVRGSRFCKEVEASLAEANRRNLKLDDQKCLNGFYAERARCVRIRQRDAAEKPEKDLILLASPRRCFFFEGTSCKVSDFQGHLRQADTKHEDLYRCMGVKDSPDAHAFAAVTHRVKEQIQHSDQIIGDAIEVLHTCVEGFHACVQSGDKSLECLESINFYLPYKLPGGPLNGKLEMERASELVWMDMGCWRGRFGSSEVQARCCYIPAIEGKDIKVEMMKSLSWAGLQPVSDLVEEAVASEVMLSDPFPGSIQAAVRKLLSSPLMLPAMEAILRGSSLGEEGIPDILTTLGNHFSSEVRSVSSQIETLLRWKDGQRKIEGSEQKKTAVHWSGQLLISEDALHHPDQLASDLFAGLCQIPGLLPCLSLPEVERPVQGLLKLVSSEGPEGIPGILKANGIKHELDVQVYLGIGDRLPDCLCEKLMYAMNVAFEDREYVVANVEGIFRIGRVAKWEDGLDNGPSMQSSSVLMRRYRVQVSPKGRHQILCHVDLYKIWSGGSEIPDFQILDGDWVVSNPGGPASDGRSGVGCDDAATLKQVKGQLRQMAKMDPDSYKKYLRRLFLTWHPDKSGNTPFNNLIFRMLKIHEAWYRGGGGDDGWLDEFGNSQEGTSQEDPPADSEAEAAPQEPKRKSGKRFHEPSSQASWFQEFERDWQSQHQARRPGKPAAPVKIFFCPEPQRWTSPRTVNEVAASTWLSQAEYDLQVMQHLKDASDSMGPPFSSATIFQASQVVEKALKSAMLHTCGLAKEEFTGQEAHKLVLLHQKLKEAGAETGPQRQAQEELPGTASDMKWLQDAYLASRYPNASGGQIPALVYDVGDAERAGQLAEQVVHWAKTLEDLPEPRQNRPCSTAVPPPRVAPIAPAPPPGPVISTPPRAPSVPKALSNREPMTAPPAAPPLTANPRKRKLGDTPRMLEQS